jgi:bifunctional DNA-binding transcriptional regulator/antitoxin component of YhaV-PrlF toxin-antitoxin module
MDGAVCDLIDRIRYGDPLLGWEGDDRIELYFDGPEERFELWRLEDDGEYRRVCRSQPGMQFDDRIIHALIQWDGRRRTKALVDEVNEHNANRQAQVEAERDEWIAEDMAPRLRHAIRKDG